MKKKAVFALILALWLPLMAATAQQVSLTFRGESLSEALRQIDHAQNDKHILFLFDELEMFSVTATIDRLPALDAVRKVCGSYPVSITEVRDAIFVEYVPKTVHLNPVMVNGMRQPLPALLTADSVPDVMADLQQYARHIVYFNRVCPQEKVYLHLDNTAYFQGETIWYAANVVNASTGGEAASKVLYVELLSPTGVILKQQKLKVVDGRCHGSFPLVDADVEEAVALRGVVGYPSGYYQIRAYTRAQLNFDEAGIFSRVIPVYRAPEQEGLYDDPIITTYEGVERDRPDLPRSGKPKDVNVAFFPEGGHLVEGLSCRVAFKVTDENGMGLDVDAIVDADDKPIVTTPMHKGMGAFVLVPRKNTEKIVVVKDGRRHTFSLPAAEPKGCTVRLDALKPDYLYIALEGRNMGRGELLGYTLTSGGKVVACDTVRFRDRNGGPTAEALLCHPKEGLPTGVCQFTLFNAHGAILAQRLFFIDNGVATIPVAVTYNKESIQPFDSISLSLQVNGTTGQRVNKSTDGAVFLSPDNGGTEGGAKTIEAEPNLFELSRVATDEERSSTSQQVNGSTDEERSSTSQQVIKPATFSLAVRDAADYGTAYRDDIRTYMLLSSELKGLIEEPGWYFESLPLTPPEGGETQANTPPSVGTLEKLNAEGQETANGGNLITPPSGGAGERLTALDLLMMVQGWTRYDWEEMAGVKPFDVRHYTEEQLVVDGWAFSRILEKPLSNTRITAQLYSPDRRLVQRASVITDSLGYWSIGVDDYMGDWALFLSAKQLSRRGLPAIYRDNATTRIRLERSSRPKVTPFRPEEVFLPHYTNPYPIVFPWQKELLPKVDVLKEPGDNVPLSYLIDEVVIEGKRRYIDYNRFQAFDADKDTEMDLDEGNYTNNVCGYLESKGYSLVYGYNDISETIPGKGFFDSTGETMPQSDSQGLSSNNGSTPHYIGIQKVEVEGHRTLWTVLFPDSTRREKAVWKEYNQFLRAQKYGQRDMALGHAGAKSVTNPWVSRGVLIGNEGSWSIDMEHVKSVLVFGYEPGHRFVEVVINMKGIDEFKPRTKRSRETTFTGYTPVVEFYAPTYPQGPIEGDKDYRRTIYWNPEVTTDADGRATVSFYNNGFSRALTVSAEGMTRDGVPIINE